MKDVKYEYGCEVTSTKECPLSIDTRRAEQIRADVIREIERTMYHEAFEVSHEEDGMQKWDSGNWIRYKLFENVIEQLKEQKKITCFHCKHHFMSDCYLECNKHNRINNNNICDDFEQLKEQKNG